MAGRPRKDFSEQDFEKLLAMQCTQEEVCGFFGCDHKTLTVWIKRNYGEDCDFIYANILVCEGAVIGGDVSSQEHNGFMQGFDFPQQGEQLVE